MNNLPQNNKAESSKSYPLNLDPKQTWRIAENKGDNATVLSASNAAPVVSAANTKPNLFNFDFKQLKAFFQNIGEPQFRAEQALKWLHQVGERDVMQWTNFSKALRQKLSDSTVVDVPEVIVHQKSLDGTQKWLLRLNDGNSIETVFIPEDDRGTLCVSSQVGCALNCTFCSTATQGFNRNLTTAEIIGQVWVAVRALSNEQGHHDRRVTNVVMMGMGEPCLNLDAVIPAMNLMMHDFAYGLSKRRVTLSTSGLVPEMLELKAQSDVALAVSLHAAFDELRDVIVPINRKYPLRELLNVCQHYFDANSRRRVTFEYVMLRDVNDRDVDAKQLIKILQGIPCKINLIPFNPFPGARYECSSVERIDAFRQRLLDAGYNTIVRKTRGDDIAAACGQLVGDFKDKTKRRMRLASQAEAQ